MIGWVRDSKRRRLVSIKPDPKSKHKSELELIEMTKGRTLSDIFILQGPLYYRTLIFLT